ncbi:hypothetical protein [Nonlabens ponticola]|uniref:TonB C-terminal domain-containing protein n=1 Tax=Nonlabens ponticola TaxID=2496866 RepID=A0A3S9MUL6_9FLAO|nr:hypothetical protein [Nonlabens ponticola]AZQ42830.1 hypothetical protein EJ995_00725 [Nonlabens ponticola]
MSKRYVNIILFCLALLVASCKTDADKNLEAQRMAQERFERVDMSEVDIYPRFDNCDELDQNKECFYEAMQELISNRLLNNQLQQTISSRDSIVALLEVNAQGQLSYKGLVDSAYHVNKVSMDSLLNIALADLPSIDSALKQGIPVATSYQLPIIIVPQEIKKSADQ